MRDQGGDSTQGDDADENGTDGALPAETTAVAKADTELDRRLVAALERIGHVTRTLLWRDAYSTGMSPMQAQLLLHLDTRRQAHRVGDLAAEFDVSPPTISDALAALRRKGLVAREQDPNDRRSFSFTPTPEGARVAADLTSWADPITAQLPVVTAEQKAATLRLLLTMIAGLHRQGVLAVARTCLTCRFFVRDAHPDTDLVHHCRLLDTAFSDAALRVDCAEHQAADPTG
ncbi:MarR family winged helix-turn-helix transcriptional regulator [Saccharothrix algeriensis]|uniref:MarR family transcriptional regulator n=1 Tax=Saccharothrix algeriensis TaxID=173560 RepID=A0A8T8I1D8_9PSEU|nr:MarR family transcriptional regulator [Saccharothrix algeriensis]MBM7810328.1 DNA-binding MarR family transcriptional regulator [Saccharothrix algeriensis]QTR04477.1 MarR family transcriptional regulator [Saccharothrix algeriensis]